MARQIVTQDQISQLLADGASELRVDADAIITDVAAELAQERNLRIIRGTAASPAPQAPPTPSGTPCGEVRRDDVKRAVIAVLGSEPEQLDAVLDRVFKA
ncbi:MAG: hypothetical protein Q4D96_01295 [Propionibacteriaceae bacterium]|nr:hypothetical protein [Propionibacteriaceae bacterium]